MNRQVDSVELVEKVARAIEGPHLPVPAASKFTLEALRDVRWKQLSRAEQQMRLNEARAAIESLSSRITDMEVALRFYAESWDERDDRNSGMKYQPDSNLLFDEGDKARACLSMKGL